jgi:hypothetical protein
MATMRIGKYTISLYYIIGKGFMYWIEAEGGEGAEYAEAHIQEAIDELWRKHF